MGKVTKDVIYRVDLSKAQSELAKEVLYVGDLGFDPDHPVQTVTDYEAVLVQKVYWTDGINRPRLINIAKPELKGAEYDDGHISSMNIANGYSDIYLDAPFDFIPDLTLGESVTIERVTNVAGGLFPACAIQYAFTYSFKYGQETNMFYQSALLYASHADRGGTAEESVYCAFRITLDNLESDRFDYVNIYSIQRTSINSAAVVQRIAQIDLSESSPSDTVVFIDTNTTGEEVDSSYLQYIGGNDILAGCIESKDGTLFAGDLTYNRQSVSNAIGDEEISFVCAYSHREVSIEGNASVNSNYQWQNQLCANTSFFKPGETYRLGFQAQYKNGEWSEPVWLEDKTFSVACRPYISSDADSAVYKCYLPQISYTLSNSSVNQALLEAGYIKIRPLAVFPAEYERSIIAQGVINGTVFQSHARELNAPFAFSSWFFRLWGDTVTPAWYNTGLLGSIVEYNHFDPLTAGRSSGMEIQNMALAIAPYNNSNFTDVMPADHDFWAKITGYSSLYAADSSSLPSSSRSTRCVSPCENYFELSTAAAGIEGGYQSTYNIWYVDNSICTFHSPEIEFDDTLYDLINSSSNIELNVVGLVEFDACLSDEDIDLESVQADPECPGAIPVSMVNSTSGARGLVSALFFRDGTIDDHDKGQVIDLVQYACGRDEYSHNWRSWLISPWHRSGSLNNDVARKSDGGTRTAVLKTKCLSNMRISNQTCFFSSTTLENEEDGSTAEVIKLSASSFKVFDSDDISLVKLPDEQNAKGDIIYYGNVDFMAITHGGFNIVCGKGQKYADSCDSKNREYTYTDPNSSSSGTSKTYKTTDTYDYGEYLRYLTQFRHGSYDNYVVYGRSNCDDEISGGKICDYVKALTCPTDGVRIKYKSTPHVVIGFDYDGNSRQNIPKYSKMNSSSKLVSSYRNITTAKASTQFWLDGYSDMTGYVKGTTLSIGDKLWANDIAPASAQAYLWLCELVQNNVTNKFGGDTKEALMRNIWVAAGEPVDIGSTTTTITFCYGDTWYQRYDCLKTYPYSTDDTNQVVEIGSFFCETHKNIDGRTDRNRGLVDNTTVSPENFNLMNDVYSQQNNFFTYQILDDDYYKVTRFPNQVFWTETKSPGAVIDNWTRLHMATSMDFNGGNGTVTAIVSSGSYLFALQDSGVSAINFNALATISTENGTPIEIAANAKVTGYSPLSTTIGCQDKFASLVTTSGLYFVDNRNHALFRIAPDGQVENISDERHVRFWFKENSSDITWRQVPYDEENDGLTNGMRLFWDSHYGDIYLVPGVDKDDTGSPVLREALCYSDLKNNTEQFTSLMTYGGAIMFPHKGKFYAIAYMDEANDLGELDLWECFPEDSLSHNCIFGTYYPFSFTFISNEDNHVDKVFDTIEMRADAYVPGDSEMELEGDTWNIGTQDGQPFDYIRVRNEYQDTGEVAATAKSLRRKFRVWRYTVPREEDSRARMRNPWAMITLGKNDPGEDFTIVHDLLTTYTPSNG